MTFKPWTSLQLNYFSFLIINLYILGKNLIWNSIKKPDSFWSHLAEHFFPTEVSILFNSYVTTRSNTSSVQIIIYVYIYIHTHQQNTIIDWLQHHTQRNSFARAGPIELLS